MFKKQITREIGIYTLTKNIAMSSTDENETMEFLSNLALKLLKKLKED